MDDSPSKQTATPTQPPWPVSPGPPIILAPVPPKITSAAVWKYAGFWRRLAASFIDGIIVWYIDSIVRDFIAAIGLDRFMNLIWISESGWLSVSWGGISAQTALMLVIGMIYFGYQESSVWQATLGKRTLGIIVTDMHGERISFARAVSRHLASWICDATFLIGYLIQPFTRKRQALHDVIARTLVLKASLPDLGEGSRRSH